MKRHLPILSVLHLVYGAVLTIGGLALLFIVLLGGFLNSDWLAETSGEAPPVWIGGLLQGLGWVLFVFLEAWGVLNLVSGMNLARQQARTLSMVTGAFNCLSIPLGLVLGIYTFITLSDPEVRAAYGLHA